MLFRKKFGKDGTYHTPQGVLTIDQGLKQSLVENFRAAASRGVRVPVTWGHQPDTAHSKADILFWRHRDGLAGWVVDMSLDDSGEIEAVIEIPMPEHAAKVGTLIREVSPVIHEQFKDGLGHKYDGFMGQLALVTYPVEPGQTNFSRVTNSQPPHQMSLGVGYGAKALSLDGPLEMYNKPTVRKPYSNQSSVYPPPDQGNRGYGGASPPPTPAPNRPTRPPQPVGQTRAMGYPGDPMIADNFGPAADPMASSLTPSMAPVDDQNSVDPRVIEELRKVARQMGLYLPDSAQTVPKIFEAMLSSLGTQALGGGVGQQDPLPGAQDPYDPENYAVEMPPNMGSSLGGGLGGVAMSLDPKAVAKKVEYDAKLDLVTRICDLRDRGVISEADEKRLASEVNATYTLSLDGAGMPIESPVEREVAVYEHLASRRVSVPVVTKPANPDRQREMVGVEVPSRGPGGSFEMSHSADDPAAAARQEAVLNEMLRFV